MLCLHAHAREMKSADPVTLTGPFLHPILQALLSSHQRRGGRMSLEESEVEKRLLVDVMLVCVRIDGCSLLSEFHFLNK